MSEKNLAAWLAGRRDIPNLSKYIRHVGVSGSDDKKLKRPAERVPQRTQQEQWTFSGALDAESINGLDDVLRVADHLTDYELIPEVSTDRELGGYLVEHDLFDVEFPREIRPYSRLWYVLCSQEKQGRNRLRKRKSHFPNQAAIAARAAAPRGSRHLKPGFAWAANGKSKGGGSGRPTHSTKPPSGAPGGCPYPFAGSTASRTR